MIPIYFRPFSRSLRPAIPAALDRIVLRGLERDKDKRWRDLESLRQALERFLEVRRGFGGFVKRPSEGAIQPLRIPILGH